MVQGTRSGPFYGYPQMKTAMILAAGRGERLRPLTDRVPKALCTVRGKPLIAHHLYHLAQAGFQNVVINHAYLGDQIRQFVQQSDQYGLNIVFSPEPPGGLETGGGIVNALDLLGSETFLTLNGDIYTNYDLRQLTLPKHSLAHAVLVHKPAYRTQGDYGLSGTGLLSNDDKNYIFSGITAYDPSFFQCAAQGRYSVTPLIRQMASQHQVSGELYQGIWFDIGSPEQLLEAQQT